MAQVLTRGWTCAPGIGATLTHYPAAGRQKPHAHDHLQVSFLLAGWLDERLEGRDYSAAGMARGHKPAGAVHSDVWGQQGALVFTLRIGPPAAAALGIDFAPGWTGLGRAGPVAALVRLLAEGGDPAAREEAAIDLLAVGLAPGHRPQAAPRWLKRIRDALHDAPERFGIAAAAREAGIHRAHLSRLFSRSYGVPPSIYRRRLLVSRAAAALARSRAPLAQVAVEAGFCDQSHLSRALRAETGLTPAGMRALLVDATFVQEERPGPC